MGLGDVQPRLEVADVLAEQVAQVRRLVRASLDRLLEIAQVERPTVEHALGVLELQADRAELRFELTELATQRNLLVGDLLLQVREFLDALLELRGDAGLGLVEGLAGLFRSPLGRERDREQGAEQDGLEGPGGEDPVAVHRFESSDHLTLMGSRTNSAICSFLRMAIALAISAADSLAGVQTQPSADEEPTPAASPLALT